MKPPVIEALFKARYRAGRGIPESRRVVTSDEVQAAIRVANQTAAKELSTRNPANFLKDIVRSETRNDLFPDYVAQRGWTVRQVTGESRSFEFYEIPAYRKTPFEVIAPPTAKVRNPHLVQSLSLARDARQFGRKDESWLTEVATDVGLIQTHLALNNRHDLVGVTKLASHVKLRKGEADVLYAGKDDQGALYLVACEMKGEREVLDQDQIGRVAEAVAAAQGTKEKAARVVPVGVKVVWPPNAQGERGLIWVREYGIDFPPLRVMSEGIYRLVPSVKGVG